MCSLTTCFTCCVAGDAARHDARPVPVDVHADRGRRHRHAGQTHGSPAGHPAHHGRHGKRARGVDENCTYIRKYSHIPTGGSLLQRERERERNVLFNDALNTFYLRLYGVRHMVKDHSDSEKRNPLLPHRLLCRLTARVLLYAPSHRQDSTYHSLCYTSRGALAGTYHHT